MPINQFINKLKNNIAVSFFVSVITLSFLFSAISMNLGLPADQSPLNSLARILTLFFAILSIIIVFNTGLYKKYINGNIIFLWLFYCYYIFVVYIDLFDTYNSGVVIRAPEKDLIMVRMTRLVLLPMVAAIIFRRKQLNTLLIAKIIFWIIFVSLVGSLSVLKLSIGQEVNERVEVEGELNSLNLGYWGATFFVLTMFLFFKTQNIYRLIYAFAGFPLGFYIVMISGSRGPLLYTILTVYVYVFFADVFKKNKRVINTIAILSLFVLVLNYRLLVSIISVFNPLLGERVIAAIEEQDSSGRDRIYLIAIDQFLKAPIFGDYFVLTSGELKGLYPHNIILEAFMTLGLTGAIPFLILIYKTLLRIRLMLKNNGDNAWVGLIFLISFLKGMSTWNLYGNMLLWVCMAVILTYSTREFNK
jgi:O-antigen ligase